jgi:tRNA isopentenyl-2-thiomethyl-A-37 hydroxylase MiaE
MSQFSIQSEIDGLKEALALEQQYLLAGRARETIALAEAKLAAMDALETAFGSLEPGSAPHAFQNDMVEIVSLAKENAVHFEAIQNGLRRAIGRMESQHANAYVGSYTQTGSQVAFTEVTGQFLKKA